MKQGEEKAEYTINLERKKSRAGTEKERA